MLILNNSIKLNKKNISVFGSSKTIESSSEFSDAYKMGELLALNGFNVVNGGYGGIMLASAKGAKEAGGHTIGVTLHKKDENDILVKGKPPNRYIAEEIPCEHLFERLYTLIKISSAFILFPGGTGTLLELAAVWELINKNLLSKRPIILFGSYWIPVVQATEKEYESDSLEKNKIEKNIVNKIVSEFSKFIFLANNPEEVIEIIVNY